MWPISKPLQNNGNLGTTSRSLDALPPSSLTPSKPSLSNLQLQDLLKIIKRLEEMKRKNTPVNDPQYVALLQILKANRSKLQALIKSKQRRKVPPKVPSTTEQIPATPSVTAFTSEQLVRLRFQISAYKKLSSNTTLSPELLKAVRGPAQTQSEPFVPTTTAQEIVTPKTSVPDSTKYNFKTFTSSPSFTFKPEAQRSTNSYQPLSAPAKLSPKFLATERERRINARLSRRLKELESLTIGNLTEEMRMKASIEIKQIKLLSLQKQLRKKVALEIRKQVALQAAEDDRIYRRRSRKNLLQTVGELQREKEGNAREKAQKEFAEAVASYAKTFNNHHHAVASKWKKINNSVQSYYRQQMKKKEKLEKRLEKERLEALRNNDEEAYRKLLEKTKNKRLSTLLGQTEDFLSTLGARVAQHQQEEEKKEQEEEEEEKKRVEGEDNKMVEYDERGVKIEKVEVVRKSAKYYSMAHSKREKVAKQPSNLVGGTLKSYQLVGLQWMVSLYNNRLNGILADEMGLGKTIQSIALICYLMEKKGNNGPYLIVAPLSTLANWDSEFLKWAPSVKRILYKGNRNQRNKIYQKKIQEGKFNVVLTTYEFVIRDKSNLGKVKWNYIIVDEGQRMKNHSCKLSLTFQHHYKSRHRVILTGTPLQNSLPELWSLLNFLLPTIFNSVDNFEEWFNAPFSTAGEKVELTEEETCLIIQRLHKVLRPFLLRRLKKDVADQLPDKIERVLRIPFSAWQKKYYTQMMKHGCIKVDGSTHKSGKKGLKNTMMQLRKICNHPYLFLDEWFIDENLIRTSGKFEALDNVLPKFKACGHRVLIFNQMTTLMNIMEDYLTMRGYSYLRLDGSTKADDRGGLLAKFNAPDSPYFIFLLSTRAGGLGLNLQTADTVILFDSDWNPQMDLQAQDRAHRIGSKKEVLVFRFVTMSSIEEEILARANFKRGMDEKIIEAGMFNRHSDESQRSEVLAAILERERAREEQDEESLPSMKELNSMFARSEEEYKLFQEMDKQRGIVKRNLITEEELPSWLQTDLSFEKDDTVYGRGMRERSEINYNDDQLDFLDDETSEEEVDLPRRRRGKARPTSDFTPKKTPAKRKRSAVTLEPINEEPKAKRTRTARKSASTKRTRTTTKKTTEPKTKRLRKSRKTTKKEVGDPVVKQQLLDIWQKLRQCKDRARKRCTLFLALPSKRHYPDYYEVIAQPICMNQIRKKIMNGQTKEEFKADFLLMFQNAHTFNLPESQIYEDATILKELMLTELAKLEEVESK